MNELKGLKLQLNNFTANLALFCERYTNLTLEDDLVIASEIEMFTYHLEPGFKFDCR